ncbi:MAG: hypothetical protein V1739_08470 [Candidatus Omnitrophota bacterium]
MRLYKLYTWSVVLEPLLFFTGLGATVGVGVSLARGLQLIFIVLYFMASLTKPIYSLNNSFFRSSLSCLKNHYWAFLFVSLTGSSLVFLSHLLTNDPFFKIVFWPGEMALLHHAYVRPFFEIIIYLYYFWYFVILPHKIFKNIGHLRYFFKVFSSVFIFNLFLGYVDIVAAWAKIHIIPRHLIEALMGSAVFVGPRFHGLAGEPRDAFVYLVLGLAIYLLTTVVLKRKINYLYISVILLALVLTQSASGLIGILLFILLALITGTCYGYVKIRHLIFIVLFSSVMIIAIVYSSERMMPYITSIQSLFKNFQTWQFSEKLEVAKVLEGQLVNIVPILHILKELTIYNFFPILFGNGIGTSSIINGFVGKNIGLSSGVYGNPNAQVIRLIYEFGIIGTSLFVLSMIRPLILLSTKVRELKINTRIIIISMLAMLGCSLAQRNSSIFIFLGMAHVSLLILKVTYSEELSGKGPNRICEGGCGAGL